MRSTANLFPSAAIALMCLASSVPARGADTAGTDVAELKRAIEELRTQNSQLAKRLSALEAEKAAQQSPAREASGVAGADASPTQASSKTGDDGLARRVKELETGKAAQEDATRAIIRDALSTRGSKINDSVSFGGAIEALAGTGSEFSGVRQSALRLNTVELDLDIQVTPWSLASMKIDNNDGTGTPFGNTGSARSGVDRLTVDTASITIGDVQRFPLYLKAGRMNLAFGSSTGVHRSDVLSIESPLTTDAFDTKRTAIGFGFGLPTPALGRPAPAVIVPPVRPLVLEPLVSSFAHQLGYTPPPERPRRPTPVVLPTEPPPFYGSLTLYEGDNIRGHRNFNRNLNARLGYRAGGHCGKRFSELSDSKLCPWSLDVNVDYLSSVFDSQFLEAEYSPFLATIGAVPGMATTLKLSLGPMLLVGEWNGAIQRAFFRDDTGASLRIKPSAWQVALGYQLGWNPWVETLGGQGTYLSFGYSQSRDFAGATQLIDNASTRVGSLPRSRWMLTVGEWVQEALNVRLEYSGTKDFRVVDGGTGANGNLVQMTLTYSW